MQLFGLDIFAGTRTQAVELILAKLSGREKQSAPFFVFTPNPEQIVQTQQDSSFKQVLKKGSLLLPDGGGVVLASKVLEIQGKAAALSERIAGVDVANDLLKSSETASLKVLLIGGRGYGQVQETSQCRDLEVQGRVIRWTPGYQNAADPTVEEEKVVEGIIRSLKPDLIFVALGAPYQEKWCIEHAELLEKNTVQVVMVVGGAFDMLLGKVKRAPQLIQRAGLEWAFRLAQEPWRWKRQLRLLNFLKLLAKEVFS